MAETIIAPIWLFSIHGGLTFHRIPYFKATKHFFADQPLRLILKPSENPFLATKPQKTYTSEDQKRQLETQLWGIASLLRDKISADDYRDYILRFIFYKYLSEKTVHLRQNPFGRGSSD